MERAGLGSFYSPGDGQRGTQELGIARRAAQRQRPADIGVQLLQDPRVRNRSREVLAEEIEERAERACHGEDIRHILLLLPGQKEILRLIRAPQIRHWRIIRSGKYGLSDV